MTNIPDQDLANREAAWRSISDSIELKNRRPLRRVEIQRIYAEAGRGKWVPDWIYDKKGRKIGYSKSSIDAWSE